MASEELHHALMRVSGTTLDEAGAANAWAGNVSSTLASLRTNLVTNPNFETDVTGWTAYVGVAAPTRVLTTPFSGVGRLSAVGNNTSTTPRVFIVVPGVAGDVITYTARVRSDGQAPTGGIAGLSTAPSGTALAFVATAWAPDGAGWQLVTATGTLPAGETAFRITPGVQTAANYTGTLGVDAVLAVNGAAAGAYFDGSSPALLLRTYAWTGTVNASTSTESTWTPGGLDLVGALNKKAGTSGLEIDGVLNVLAGTTGQGNGVNACAAALV